MKCITTLVSEGPAQSQREQIDKYLSLLKTTKADVYLQMQNDHKLPTSDDELLLVFMKRRSLSIILKHILNSIMMAVMGKSKANDLTQKQEEQIYCQFVEDFINFCFLKKDDQ